MTYDPQGNPQLCPPFEKSDLPIPDGVLPSAASVLVMPVVITPIVFVPIDQTYPSAQIGAIDEAIDDVETWYRTRLGNGSLRFDARQAVFGAHTAQEYADTIWGTAPVEIESALGFGPWTPGHIVFLMGVGLKGWAGGAGVGTSGFAVVGLEPLINTPACDGAWWCNPTMWRGAAIHELGHTLTLPHSEAPSIMGWHGDYLDKLLFHTTAWPEKNVIRAHGAFELTLGAGEPNWTSCSSDEDCLTMRCGCNGGPERVCLPTDNYMKFCASPVYSPCLVDTDCASDWCGCNGGDMRMCLPTPGYPKDCQFPNWTPCSEDDDCSSERCGCNGGTQPFCLPSVAYPKTCQ